MSGGECKVKEPPPHVILGKTQSDQNWIDGEVEVGVTVCGFPRPGPRPASLDAPPATRQLAADPVPRAKPKKQGFVRRIKERVFPQRAEPVPALPSIIVHGPSPAPDPAPAAPVERPRRDPVDELLDPKG